MIEIGMYKCMPISVFHKNLKLDERSSVGWNIAFQLTGDCPFDGYFAGMGKFRQN